MKTIVIGGKGHIGTYLVPRLVEAGHTVVNVSRGQAQPYRPHAAWARVEDVTIDRDAAERTGEFGAHIAALGGDVVVDLICFTRESAQQLVEALRGRVQHFLHCGTIWTHGPSAVVPTTEDQPKQPFGEYGVRKAQIETYLLDQARRLGFPATLLHPGHIVGLGWAPLNPAGHFSPRVFEQLARGERLALPNFGMETVHHVHADDVAQSFQRAIERRSAAVGESFHVVSPQAVSLRGYAEAMAAWFGAAPNLEYLPWDEWKKTVSDDEARATWDHIAHSPNCSIEKARRLIGYEPRYGSLQAVQEAVEWLIAHGRIRRQ